LRAKKPVLVEKPMAMTSAGARRLAQLARETNTFAMEAFWPVFLPAVSRLRTLIADNTIGSVTGIRAELAYVKALDSDSRFFSKALGGGSLFDLGVYPI